MDDGHFFASSIATWTVASAADFSTLYHRMVLEGYPWSLYWVPCPVDTPYEIRGYQPIVHGVVHLQFFKECS